MSSKLLSLYSSWREKKQYSTQISQNETTNNDSFDILIEEEQRKSIEINQKLINEEEINLDYNFEFPEITVDTSFEKQRKKRLFTSLFKFFTISLSILLILFICTLIIFLSLIFISHYNQPIHITIIDNTELNEQHADYEFYDVYFGEYPSINLSENETNIPFKPHSFTKDESKDIIEFFAVSDFHLDISYDSNKVCKNQGEQDKRQRGDTNNYKLGQYQCDSPEDLLKSLFVFNFNFKLSFLLIIKFRFKKMTSFNTNPDFILLFVFFFIKLIILLAMYPFGAKFFIFTILF